MLSGKMGKEVMKEKRTEKARRMGVAQLDFCLTSTLRLTCLDVK